MIDSIIVEIEKKSLVNDIKKSFSDIGATINMVDILEYTENKQIVKISTSKHNIVVESIDDKLTWKLDSLNMGDVFGKDICDVAGSYQFELSKDK